MAGWHDRNVTAPHLSLHAVLICLLTLLVRVTTALQSVTGSPCESVCASAGSLSDDVVCLDADYQSLQQGRAFNQCVACQLNSTAIDTSKNETDVEWGLLALRYTLAGCMFAIPEDRISISSPCQVSCAVLNETIGYEITNDTSTSQPGEAFCNVGDFDDTSINRCALCYSYIPQQLFLANFLQALHIACRQPPVAGKPFFPDAASIFNETLIAGPTSASNSNSSTSGLHGWKLPLAIALPIVGGILLLGSTCWCCFAYTRKRRQRMAQTGRMSRVHDQHADSLYSPMSAKAVESWGRAEPPTEMHAISPTLSGHNAHAKQPSPGLAQGRWSHQMTPGQKSDLARWSAQQQLAVSAGGSKEGTPLRSSFQREDVGPGRDQVQDPNLHEQFFGVDDEDIDGDLPGPSDGQQHPYFPQPGVHGAGPGDAQQSYYPYPTGVHGAGGLHAQDYHSGHFI
ncbi:hypothetical protein EDD37DRAFT_651749 [Exophiala viscosa]|uniref:uncharacterized protein n=1 Tax=Exophiala viscosa TaxID=2486360 RepID=UPI002196E401|nr:hypothetical protein EDD37DRAFT_651749 [Exophiala viscosa]